MNLTIGSKLLAGFMGLVLLLVVVGVTAYVSFNSFSDSTRQLVEASDLALNTNKLARYLTHVQEALTDFSLTGNKEAKQEAEKYREAGG